MKKRSIFLKEQGDTPRNRIWSFLIVHSEYDYSMKDIAKYSKVGYTTLKKIWKDFKKSKIVVQTRTVGKAKMYKLNLKNHIVEKFIDFYWAVVDSVVRKELDKKEEKPEYSGSGEVSVPVSAKTI